MKFFILSILLVIETFFATSRSFYDYKSFSLISSFDNNKFTYTNYKTNSSLELINQNSSFVTAFNIYYNSRNSEEVKIGYYLNQLFNNKIKIYDKNTFKLLFSNIISKRFDQYSFIRFKGETGPGFSILKVNRNNFTNILLSIYNYDYYKGSLINDNITIFKDFLTFLFDIELGIKPSDFLILSLTFGGIYNIGYEGIYPDVYSSGFVHDYLYHLYINIKYNSQKMEPFVSIGMNQLFQSNLLGRYSQTSGINILFKFGIKFKFSLLCFG